MRVRSARGSVDDATQHACRWDRHAQRIYRYCFRRTADHELAEDLTSIVFLEAWRRRRSVDLSIESEELRWLYGIATNVLRNQWRTQRRHRAALARLPRAGAVVDDAAESAIDRLDDQERMAWLVRKLRTLPAIEQEALVLCVWEDMTPKEVAGALGVPEATVRTRLHRARKRLRVLYSAYGCAPLGGVPRAEGEGS